MSTKKNFESIDALWDPLRLKLERAYLPTPLAMLFWEVLRDLFFEVGLRFFHDVFECVDCTAIGALSRREITESPGERALGPGLPRHAPREKIAWGMGAWGLGAY